VKEFQVSIGHLAVADDLSTGGLSECLADAAFCLNSSRIVGLGIATTLAVSAVA
jgi:hypothetical protein